MKKLSLILALIMLMSVVLISCDNSDIISSEGTTEGSTTAATSSPDVTTTGATTAPTPLKVPEPENPEPIHIGMTEAELREVEDEMKELSNDTFLYFDGVAFWIDENGNNAVAEIKKIDGEWKVASIDRYFPAAATAETFEMIKKMRNEEGVTVQKIVELAGIPYRIAPTSGVSGVSYRDMNMMEYCVGYNGDYSSRVGFAKEGFDELVELLTTKYSMDNVEIHRVFLEESDDADYNYIYVQGVYGEEKTPWSKRFNIPEHDYNHYSNYRNTQNGILYNVVITDEFDYIYYDVKDSLFYSLVRYIEGLPIT